MNKFLKLAGKQVINNTFILIMLLIGFLPFIGMIDSHVEQTKRGDLITMFVVYVYMFVIGIVCARIVYLIKKRKFDIQVNNAQMSAFK